MLNLDGRWICLLALAASAVAHAQTSRIEVATAGIDPTAPAPTVGFEADGTRIPRTPLLDRVQRGVYETVYLSAMRIDGFFGPLDDERIYERSSGSIAPALLWDEREGFKPKLRFRIDLPLPRLDERFRAFVGRVDREEYVSGRKPPSGAIPRPATAALVPDEQTLLGIGYRDRRIKRGWNFDADGGVRVRTPLDPYVKAGGRFESGRIDGVRLMLSEHVFWQASEDWGFTSRVDLDRYFGERLLVRWTGSGTITEKSEGVRGYSEIFALRTLANRRAIALSVDVYGESDAPVNLQHYGTKFAWRQSVLRPWLVLELRTGVSWVRELPGEPREPSIGVGLGLEMFFGTDEFLARPMTF
jgi:hypothetical protein